MAVWCKWLDTSRLEREALTGRKGSSPFTATILAMIVTRFEVQKSGRETQVCTKTRTNLSAPPFAGWRMAAWTKGKLEEPIHSM